MLPVAPLPPGLASRPLVRSDLAAVAAVMAAQEVADLGTALIDEAAVEAHWQRPSCDLGADSVGVLRDGVLIAYAEIVTPDQGEIAVLPAHRSPALVDFLAGWLTARGSIRGTRSIGLPVPRGAWLDDALARLGFDVRWTSWVLELPPGADVPQRALPSGYSLRSATPADHRACWAVLEDAFLEFADRDRPSFEDWVATVPGRPGLAPYNLRVVTSADGEIVAVALALVSGEEGYVDQLATRVDHRDRGLAQALLADAFAQTSARGATRFGLSTDSRTGAIGLYEKVGLVVTSTWVHRAVDL